MDDHTIPTSSSKEEDKKEDLNLEDWAQKLKVCEERSQEYLNGWQRAKADFINYKREEGERTEHLVRFAHEDLLKDLIIILDNFDLALAALQKQGSVDQGIYLIRNLLLDTLRKKGLERIRIERGAPFDPVYAEAIVEVESELPEGSVVEEVEAGYLLHQKVIRPARVKVSKKK